MLWSCRSPSLSTPAPSICGKGDWCAHKLIYRSSSSKITDAYALQLHLHKSQACFLFHRRHTHTHVTPCWFRSSNPACWESPCPKGGSQEKDVLWRYSRVSCIQPHQPSLQALQRPSAATSLALEKERKRRRLVIDFASVIANSVHSISRQGRHICREIESLEIPSSPRLPLPPSILSTTEKFHFSAVSRKCKWRTFAF